MGRPTVAIAAVEHVVLPAIADIVLVDQPVAGALEQFTYHVDARVEPELRR